MGKLAINFFFVWAHKQKINLFFQKHGITLHKTLHPVTGYASSKCLMWTRWL